MGSDLYQMHRDPWVLRDRIQRLIDEISVLKAEQEILSLSLSLLSGNKKCWVIIKASREYCGGNGYSGPSCKNALVESGKIYTSLKEAIHDARKLAAVNPVGFVVVPYQKGR